MNPKPMIAARPSDAAPTVVVCELLNEHEASAILRVPVATVRYWRVRGGGPPYAKIGAAVRYRRADLDAFVAARVVGSTAEAAALPEELRPVSRPARPKAEGAEGDAPARATTAAAAGAPPGRPTRKGARRPAR